MCRQACLLAVVLVLGGCAPWPHANHNMAQPIAAVQVETSAAAESRKEGKKHPRRKLSRATRAKTPAAQLFNPAVTFAEGAPVDAMETGNIDQPSPDQANAARRMDEQAQKWNTTAQHAIGSICRGC